MTGAVTIEPPAGPPRAQRVRATRGKAHVTSAEFLWYIPNEARPGHRGDDVADDHNSLHTLAGQAQALEQHGWGGALIGAGWRAWADAEAKVARMGEAGATGAADVNWQAAAGQRRLLDLAARADVLDDNLYTAPGRFGAVGAGASWLVGSAQDVARSLRRYQELGITHFVLSDTPYLSELRRQGEQLLPLLRG